MKFSARQYQMSPGNFELIFNDEQEIKNRAFGKSALMIRSLTLKNWTRTQYDRWN